MHSTALTRIDVSAYRCPIQRPVRTSFGIMRNRPAVFVRVSDAEGCHGWGEIFANWPAAGAEHRVNLLADDIGDLVLGRPLEHPSDLFRHLEAATHVRAVQCGELGPFRQVIAGLDIAVWDLFARRSGKPVSALLSQTERPAVPAYASGIAIDSADAEVCRAREAGFTAFKVKVGFDLDSDVAQTVALLGSLASHERLAADANQAWDVATAARFAEALGSHELNWLEEPIRVDAPDEDWRALAGRSQIPLAGGENIAGMSDFARATALGALAVFQPDVAKWGGFTGCLAVARNVLAAKRRYCPHFLGGGIGLVASAHLLAAAGGDGMLEVDVNPNPLRDLIAPMTTLRDGCWQLDTTPGLGIEELPSELARYRTLERTLTV